MDWQSAANYCSHKWNCGLAAITSSAEQAALASYLKKKNCKFVCCNVETGVSGDSMNWDTGFPRASIGETQQLFTKALQYFLQ